MSSSRADQLYIQMQFLPEQLFKEESWLLESTASVLAIHYLHFQISTGSIMLSPWLWELWALLIRAPVPLLISTIIPSASHVAAAQCQTSSRYRSRGAVYNIKYYNGGKIDHGMVVSIRLNETADPVSISAASTFSSHPVFSWRRWCGLLLFCIKVFGWSEMLFRSWQM